MGSVGVRGGSKKRGIFSRGPSAGPPQAEAVAGTDGLVLLGPASSRSVERLVGSSTASSPFAVIRC